VQILPVTAFAKGGRILDIAWSDFPLSTTQENKIIAFSLAQANKPYGRLTFVWIGLAILLHWQTPAWLERRLDNGETWTCSQLTDAAYQHGGIRLFRDGRPAGAVYPGSIARIFYDFGWTDKT
jgi:hypothetical protein